MHCLIEPVSVRSESEIIWTIFIAEPQPQYSGSDISGRGETGGEPACGLVRHSRYCHAVGGPCGFSLSGRGELPVHPGALHLTATSRYKSEDSACLSLSEGNRHEGGGVPLGVTIAEEIFPQDRAGFDIIPGQFRR